MQNLITFIDKCVHKWQFESHFQFVVTHLFSFQVVQRINSIYCTKRGKKRLKKLSLSNIETASLRGKDFYHDVSSQNVFSWPSDIKQPFYSVCRWQQWEWKWLRRQVQRWGISTYSWVGYVFELSALSFEQTTSHDPVICHKQMSKLSSVIYILLMYLYFWIYCYFIQ